MEILKLLTLIFGGISFILLITILVRSTRKTGTEKKSKLDGETERCLIIFTISTLCLLGALIIGVIQFIFWIVSIIVIVFSSSVLAWTLAKSSLFWTMMEEGQARSILLNGAFSRFLMSYKNKIFAWEDPDTYYSDIEMEKKWYKMQKRDKEKYLRKINAERAKEKKSAIRNIYHPWTIVPDVKGMSKGRIFFMLPGFLIGIRWVGIPPFAEIYYYRFRWTSIEEKADPEKGQTKKVPYTTDKVINYINLKPDVFLITVTAAETSELLPLDIKLAITLQIINPYKALYDVEKWLENVESQVGAKVRKHVGTLSYKDLIQGMIKSKSKVVRGKESMLSNEILEHILDSIREEYGVDITRIQILDVNPGSDQAKEFILASIQEFIKERKAAGDIKEAAGFKAKYAAISEFKEGPDMYKHEMVRDSKLRVYSTGGKQQEVVPTVTVDDLTNDDAEEDSNKTKSDEKGAKE